VFRWFTLYNHKNKIIYTNLIIFTFQLQRTYVRHTVVNKKGAGRFVVLMGRRMEFECWHSYRNYQI